MVVGAGAGFAGRRWAQREITRRLARYLPAANRAKAANDLRSRIESGLGGVRRAANQAERRLKDLRG